MLSGPSRNAKSVCTDRLIMQNPGVFGKEMFLVLLQTCGNLSLEYFIIDVVAKICHLVSIFTVETLSVFCEMSRSHEVLLGCLSTRTFQGDAVVERLRLG